MFNRGKKVQMPEEFSFKEEDIGDTGKRKNSWTDRHRRAFALFSLATLGFGTAGGSYLGYEIGAGNASSAAKNHAEKATELRQCVATLQPYIRGELARVRFSELSEESKINCGLSPLPGYIDDGIDQFNSYHPNVHFKIGELDFDAPLTFDVADMQYDAAVHEHKSRSEGNKERLIGAATGGALGFLAACMTIITVANPKWISRAGKNFVDGISGHNKE